MSFLCVVVKSMDVVMLLLSLDVPLDRWRSDARWSQQLIGLSELVFSSHWYDKNDKKKRMNEKKWRRVEWKGKCLNKSVQFSSGLFAYHRQKRPPRTHRGSRTSQWGFARRFQRRSHRKKEENRTACVCVRMNINCSVGVLLYVLCFFLFFSFSLLINIHCYSSFFFFYSFFLSFFVHLSLSLYSHFVWIHTPSHPLLSPSSPSLSLHTGCMWWRPPPTGPPRARTPSPPGSPVLGWGWDGREEKESMCEFGVEESERGEWTCVNLE